MTKILIDEATVKLVLEALETSPMSRKNKDAIDVLREALAEQPAQQEYASFAEWAHDYVQDNLHKLKPAQLAPRTWVGLTPEEIMAIVREMGLKCRLGGSPNIDFDYAEALEAKLRSKNEDRN